MKAMEKLGQDEDCPGNYFLLKYHRLELNQYIEAPRAAPFAAKNKEE